jgi:hypothetical protein
MCVALALFALPASAQVPGQSTPATLGLCDGLADATPGLQGLCVAMCEAQACEAELDPATDDVVFNPSCNASAPQLLANYDRKRGPSDPRMPCVKVACPCWTEAEIENIGGGMVGDRLIDSCSLDPVGESWAGLFGVSTDGGGWEQAYALDVNEAMCISIQTDPSDVTSASTTRQKSLSADEYLVCQQSVVDQCKSRGLVQ